MTTTTVPSSTSTAARSPLRTLLTLDALVTGVNGAAYLAAAPFLADLLGLPAGALRGAGAFLLGYTAAVWFTASRPVVSRSAATAVVVVNVLWVLDSAALALTGLGTPTAAGTAWTWAQAAVVAGFAALQWSALRRSAPRSGLRGGAR